MSKLFKYSTEELEIDKALKQVDALDMNNSEELLINSETQKTQEENQTKEVIDTPAEGEQTPSGDNDPVDDTSSVDETTTDENTDDSLTVSSIGQSIEDQEIEDNSVAVESIITLITSAIKSTKSLEEIADIIENAQDTNGISPVAATMIEAATGELYSQVGIDREEAPTISTESLAVHSYRVKYAKEALNEIKNKIIEIFNAIISSIRKIYDYIKKLILSFTSNIEKEVKSLKEMRSAFRNINKDAPSATELKGIYPKYLFSSNSDAKGLDALAVCKKTIEITKQLANSFPKRSKTSHEAINTVYSEMFKIVLDNKDPIDEILNTPESVRKVIGGDLPSCFKRVQQTQNNNLGKVEEYKTDNIFGGNYLYSYIPLDKDSIISSKTGINVDPLFKPKISISVLEKGDIPQALELCEDLLNIRLDLIKSLDDSNKEFEKLSKLSATASDKLSKNDLDQPNSRKMALLLSTLIRAIATSNITPNKEINNYMDKYSKCLIHYTRSCIKLYL